MLCSQDTFERQYAVDKIVSIRGPGDGKTQVGDSSPRPRITPLINIKASTLTEMIDWNTLDLTEPPMTTSLTTVELKHLIESPMEVPSWSSHTQAVERCVKMVT